MQYALPIVILLILLLVVTNIKMVSQSNAYVVQRLGAYLKTWGVGLHFLIPFIDRVAKRVTLRSRWPTSCPSRLSRRITLPCRSTPLSISRSPTRSSSPTAWTDRCRPLRTSRPPPQKHHRRAGPRPDPDFKGRDQLADARDPRRGHRPVGIKINRWSLNIMPPKTILEAMEKQMKAERERREAILRAEGERDRPSWSPRAKRKRPFFGRRPARRRPYARRRASRGHPQGAKGDGRGR